MFRRAIITAPNQRLAGDITIAVPLGWHVVGLMLLATVLIALGFLATARYSRAETVPGEIVADIGVATIIANRPGVLAELAVRDGDAVALGAVLGTVQTETETPDDPSAGARMAAAIERRSASVAERVLAAASETSARQTQIIAQRRGLLAEAEQLTEQIAIQERLIATAEADLARLRALGSSGYVSPRDLGQREDTVLSRRQVLSELNRSLLAKRTSLRELGIAEQNLTATTRAERASLSALQAESDERAAAVAGMRSYALRAPVAGRVTALTARIGQPMTPDKPLMLLVPTGARPIAELRVPSSAIGFVRSGQRVRLAIDAFPFQSFGTVGGTVSTVAKAPIFATSVDARGRPFYPVTIAIDRPYITAYGREEPLVFGMTVSARIVIERRSLMGWLFEPVLAVRRRQEN